MMRTAKAEFLLLHLNSLYSICCYSEAGYRLRFFCGMPKGYRISSKIHSMIRFKGDGMKSVELFNVLCNFYTIAVIYVKLITN